MIFWSLLTPFFGTALGAACVFFLKKGLGDRVQRGLTGFASGVMVAASIWSLLIPAMEQSAGVGGWAFLPAVKIGRASCRERVWSAVVAASGQGETSASGA